MLLYGQGQVIINTVCTAHTQVLENLHNAGLIAFAAVVAGEDGEDPRARILLRLHMGWGLPSTLIPSRSRSCIYFICRPWTCWGILAMGNHLCGYVTHACWMSWCGFWRCSTWLGSASSSSSTWSSAWTTWACTFSSSSSFCSWCGSCTCWGLSGRGLRRRRPVEERYDPDVLVFPLRLPSLSRRGPPWTYPCCRGRPRTVCLLSTTRRQRLTRAGLTNTAVSVACHHLIRVCIIPCQRWILLAEEFLLYNTWGI